MTKYIAISVLCSKVGADTEAKQKEVVSLLTSAEFTEGRVPVTRNNDVFVPYDTVNVAAHNGPVGFPADQMYDVFADLEFGELPAEEAPARPARAPRSPRTPSADTPAISEAERNVGAALTGLPEAEVGTPAGSAPVQPTIVPDAPAEEKPKSSRRRSNKTETATAPAEKPVEPTPAAEDAPQSAVDAAVERTKFAAARISRDDAMATLVSRKQALELELAAIMFAIENI